MCSIGGQVILRGDREKLCKKKGFQFFLQSNGGCHIFVRGNNQNGGTRTP